MYHITLVMLLFLLNGKEGDYDEYSINEADLGVIKRYASLRSNIDNLYVE